MKKKEESLGRFEIALVPTKEDVAKSKLYKEISERKFGFRNIYNISTFEIKELTSEQIRTLAINYTGSRSSEIINYIEKNSHLQQLAHIPLLLKMILIVCSQGSFPQNKGALYSLFLDEILKREEIKVLKKASNIIKKELLSHLAFQMRQIQKVLLPYEKVKEVFRKKINEIHGQVPTIDVIEELLDSNIISKNTQGDILFYHESYLDFYAAVEIKKIFEVHGTLPTMSNILWVEPLVIASDVVKKLNISVKVNGGGEHGQADAVRLAIARALVQHDDKLKKIFDQYDRLLLVADVRRKEVCKPNDSKARAKRQKSYR